MRDTRAAQPSSASAFGQVDLDIGEDVGGTIRPAASPSSSPAFGHVDLDMSPPSSDSLLRDGGEPPPSTSRVFETTERNTRATIRKPSPSVHDDSTRIVQGDALAAITRPPPAGSPLMDDGNTRAWADVDEALLSVGDRNAPEPPSSRSGHLPAPSGSGVATRGGRVAAMRELYARGDADGALALAATLESAAPAPYDAADGPEASIVVEFGEESIDLSDPFGGLLLAEEEEAVGGAVTTAGPPPCAAPQLTLTERHSIPKLLKSMGEVSKLKIDHRAGFLLAHVDGMQTLEEILDVCAMPAKEALELIAQLKEMGVIEFE